MRSIALIVAASALSALAVPWSGFSLQKPGDSPVRTMDSWSWEDCGLPGDLVDIQSIEVSPDPPKPGQNLTVTAKGYANSVIEEGAYANVVVKLGAIKLLTKTFDVCEEARNANSDIQCPVDRGEHVVVQTVELPKEIPHAKFVVQVRAFSVDEDPIICANIKVDFMKRPF